jgi:hypothetical protein
MCTRKQRDDLDRQAQRMTRFANASGLSVVAVIKEVGFGVTDTLPKLTALSEEYLWSTLVVEQTVSGASMLCSGCGGSETCCRRRDRGERRSARRLRVDPLQLLLLACTGCGRRDAGPR